MLLGSKRERKLSLDFCVRELPTIAHHYGKDSGDALSIWLHDLRQRQRAGITVTQIRDKPADKRRGACFGRRHGCDSDSFVAWSVADLASLQPLPGVAALDDRTAPISFRAYNAVRGCQRESTFGPSDASDVASTSTAGAGASPRPAPPRRGRPMPACMEVGRNAARLTPRNLAWTRASPKPLQARTLPDGTHPALCARGEESLQKKLRDPESARRRRRKANKNLFFPFSCRPLRCGPCASTAVPHAAGHRPRVSRIGLSLAYRRRWSECEKVLFLRPRAATAWKELLQVGHSCASSERWPRTLTGASRLGGGSGAWHERVR